MKNEPSWCSVGEYLGRRLEQAGIRHYFTVPGDFNLVLLDQLLKNPRLQLIGCCNELNAGYAAEGYARSNGIGAFLVTYSVGGLSALNAVACAYAEDLPVVAVGGGINSDSEAEGWLIHHALGEVRDDYQRQIYAQVTAGAFAVRHQDEAPAVIDLAIATALRCRKPVYLEIACNLASLSVPAPAPRGFSAGRPSDPASLAAAVEHAADLLARASPSTPATVARNSGSGGAASLPPTDAHREHSPEGREGWDDWRHRDDDVRTSVIPMGFEDITDGATKLVSDKPADRRRLEPATKPRGVWSSNPAVALWGTMVGKKVVMAVKRSCLGCDDGGVTFPVPFRRGVSHVQLSATRLSDGGRGVRGRHDRSSGRDQAG